MKGYNLIAVFSPERKQWLMCRRRKPPYRGLLNLVGGKIEEGENGFDAAHRELLEETGLSQTDVSLRHLMDFRYPYYDFYMEVYFGDLSCPKAVFGEENALEWIDITEDFFDVTRFAGDGNLGHIMRHIRLIWEDEKKI